MRYIIVAGSFLVLFGCCFSGAQTNLYWMTDTGPGEQIGIVLLTDTEQGLLVRVSVENLPPGPHGFHVHENPSCQAVLRSDGTLQYAGQAGDHYDPHQTHRHAGPNGAGHLGDLPLLVADEDGFAAAQFYITDLTVRDLNNRSLVIHADGDNYQDTPLPSGGGGDRIACGIIRISD